MANWQRTLNIADIWATMEEKGEPSVAAGAKEIARRLVVVADFPAPHGYLNDTRNVLIGYFKGVASLGLDATYDDFNTAMQRLYDWGDTAYLPVKGGKVCWIER